MAYNTLENKIHAIYWKALGRKATDNELSSEKGFIMAGNPQPSEMFTRFSDMGKRLGTTKTTKKGLV